TDEAADGEDGHQRSKRRLGKSGGDEESLLGSGPTQKASSAGRPTRFSCWRVLLRRSRFSRRRPEIHRRPTPRPDSASNPRPHADPAAPTAASGSSGNPAWMRKYASNTHVGGANAGTTLRATAATQTITQSSTRASSPSPPC